MRLCLIVINLFLVYGILLFDFLLGFVDCLLPLLQKLLESLAVRLQNLLELWLSLEVVQSDVVINVVHVALKLIEENVVHLGGHLAPQSENHLALDLVFADLVEKQLFEIDLRLQLLSK